MEIKLVKLQQEYKIEAPSKVLYRAITQDIGSWWTHCFKKNHKGIFLEEKIGGKFYEDWGNRAGAIYATVSYLEPGTKIRLTGPMGMDGVVYGIIEFALEEKGNYCLLKLSHDIMGDVDEETKMSYSEGWKILLGKELPGFIRKIS